MTVLTQHSRPSWKQGFARSAGESAFPNLWKGLEDAWLTSLGPTGSTVHEVVNKHDGTLVGNTDWFIDERGYSLDYDGDGDRLTTIGGGDLTFEGEHTFLCWFHADSVNNNCLIHQAKTTHVNGYLLYIDDTPQLRFLHDQAELMTYAFSDTTDWHQVAITSVATNWALYLDGAEVDTGVDAYTTLTGERFIGIRDNGGGDLDWNGRIGDVLIYSRALSPSEIQQLYIDPLAPFRRRGVMGLVSVGEAPSGRIMSSLVGAGGLAGVGGIAGIGGGLAG